MKNLQTSISAMLITALTAAAAHGATTAQIGHRATALRSRSLFPLRIGADVKIEKRSMDPAGVARELQARTYSGFAGYDLLPWLTLFGTIGATETVWEHEAEYADMGLAWSAGINLALWSLEVAEPGFMAGQLRISLTGEYADKRDGGDRMDARTSWREYYAALPVSYEIFTTTAADLTRLPYSLVLHAGPCFSHIEGNYDRSGLPGTSFNARERFGVTGGLTVYIARNLSLGGQLQYIGAPAYGGSLRYQF